MPAAREVCVAARGVVEAGSGAHGEGYAVSEQVDTSQGWCCDGRTWHEHASEDGECCQPQGTQLSDLPPEGQRLARERLAQGS
jgi:hypothetical protein